MMMASLSSFAQYPTTKKIKGQQVVIMTVKQADAINTKFDKLEDSISILNSTLNGCITSLNFTEDKLLSTTENLNKSKDSLIKINKIFYQEMKRVEKLEWVEKRTRVKIGFGVAAVLATWLVMIITNLSS
jgi:hypothetical protein